MSFFNQHSFTLSAAVGVILLAAYLSRGGFSRNDLVALAALIVGLILAYMLFAPGESSHEDASKVQAEIGAGTPVLLEFQSKY